MDQERTKIGVTIDKRRALSKPVGSHPGPPSCHLPVRIYQRSVFHHAKTELTGCSKPQTRRACVVVYESAVTPSPLHPIRSKLEKKSAWHDIIQQSVLQCLIPSTPQPTTTSLKTACSAKHPLTLHSREMDVRIPSQQRRKRSHVDTCTDVGPPPRLNGRCKTRVDKAWGNSCIFKGI